MQADVVLVAAERRLIERAEEVILLVDSSKFQGSGNVVCDLDQIDVVVTDAGVAKRDLAMLKSAGIKVIVAESPRARARRRVGSAVSGRTLG
jgi:DeoR family ulaG and ulaABCDEF operon transcriptional repressor